MIYKQPSLLYSNIQLVETLLLKQQAIQKSVYKRVLPDMGDLSSTRLDVSSRHSESNGNPDHPGDDDRRKIWSWNKTVPIQIKQSLHHLFSSQAVMAPQCPAVTAWDGRMSYGELERLSDKYADILLQFNVQREEIIPICFEKSKWAIVAILAVLKAGAAFAPLDPDHPQSRHEEIFQQAKATKIITSNAGMKRYGKIWEERDMVVITVGHENITKPQVDRHYDKKLAIRKHPIVEASQLAYVLFTSGSTGTPKGVVLEHGAVATSCLAHGSAFGFSHHTRALQFTNLMFDVAVTEIITTLLFGGCICIPSEYERRNDLTGAIRSMEVNWAYFTPTVAQLIDPADVPTLKMVVLGGEQVNIADCERWRDCERLVQGYGPTETCIFSSCFVGIHGFIPGMIGKGITSVNWVVDPDDYNKLAPLGAIGELLVEGPILARGYLDNPEKTAMAFIDSPSWLLKGGLGYPGRQGRMYRTGDLVRYDDDGNLIWMGRKDSQVKIRGQRVELGEIESTLLTHGSISQAAVVVSKSDSTGLVGFVTLLSRAGISSGNVSDPRTDASVVSMWKNRYDSETYTPLQSDGPQSVGRDFIGWTSMYDGSQIDEEEMSEWLDDTIKTIINGRDAGSVLEIGSGSGMILFNLAKHGLQKYTGLDLSETAIQYLTDASASILALKNRVTLYRGSAAELATFALPTDIDHVVVNSVAQYFPSLAYLSRVVQHLLRLGVRHSIFFGDIRSKALKDEFFAARALHITKGIATKSEFARMMTDMEDAEMELFIDPEFFTSLATALPHLVEHVEILPKRMAATNELSCYRYAAIIYPRNAGGQERHIHSIPQDSWIDFPTRSLDKTSLSKQLENLSGSSIFALRNITNSKTVLSNVLVDAVKCVDASKTSVDDPECWVDALQEQAKNTLSFSALDLVQIAKDSRCNVEISWNKQYSQHGGLDAVFHRFDKEGAGERTLFRFDTDRAVSPTNRTRDTSLQQQGASQKIELELQEMLQGKLPSYMVPQRISVLDHMPLNSNFKIDRKVLAQRKLESARRTTSFRSPILDDEKLLQQLWCEILDLEKEALGLDDSFFRLGGNSIDAMKLVAKARNQGVQLTVSTIFRYPSLFDLARQCRTQQLTTNEDLPNFSMLGTDVDLNRICDEVAASCCVEAAAIEDIYPCSPLQEGLMSLTAKTSGNYVMQYILELKSNVDEVAFMKAWDNFVGSAAAAIFRTRIVQHTTQGLIQVVVKEDIDWLIAEDLEIYLLQESSAPMGLGDSLAHYAIVEDRAKHGKKQFVWTVHHALHDGYSLPQVLESVKLNYQDSKLQERACFNAFINHISRLDQEDAAKYWKKSLSECEATPFPPRPTTVKSFTASSVARETCQIPPSFGLSGITESTLIRAAWAIATSSYTGSNDVIFGATVTGRNAPIPKIETVLGPTIATVPVRICLRRDQTVYDLLQTTQRQAIDMIPYEQTGLQRIAKMGPDAQHACGFQTLLIVQTGHNGLGDDGVLGTWRSTTKLQSVTSYPLMVQCELGSRNIEITASFDERAIRPWQVETLLRQFHLVVKQLATAGPNAKLGEISTLTPEDREKLWKWNSEVPSKLDICIHNAFTGQTMKQPRAQAIDAWDGNMTYGDLHDRSSRLASHLVSVVKVKIGDTIPLCFQKSKWTIMAALAVLKAGATFVFLDTAQPIARLQAIVKFTKARLVLSSETSGKWSAQLDARVLFVDQELESMKNIAAQNILQTVPSSATAYIVFTSGSTGNPKGIAMQHDSFCTAVQSQADLLGFTPRSRVFDFASYSFDVAIHNAFATLMVGGCLCVPSEEERKGDLGLVMSHMRATLVDLTPSVASLVNPEDVPTLSTLILAGEKVEPKDVLRWPRSVKVINAYGPAECAPMATINSNVNRSAPSISIGIGVGVNTWVVDPDDTDVLLGVGSVGELLLEGALLSKEYLHDVEKTNAMFPRDPAWLKDGCGSYPGRHGTLYKTGDLVKYEADGSLTYVGRKDSQIKVRGQRVELGEIEHHVRQCIPTARNVAAEVVRLTDGNGSAGIAKIAVFLQLKAAAGSRCGPDPTVVHSAEWDQLLGQRLPTYMMPEIYLVMESLPTTPSGKMDRKRLREVGASITVRELANVHADTRAVQRLPKTATEKKLRELWAQILEIDVGSIALDDKFLQLGGDSISAMRLVAEARKHDIAISASSIFQHPRLIDLAHFSDTQENRVADAAILKPFALLDGSLNVEYLRQQVAASCGVKARVIDDIYPCSPLQEGLLSLSSKRAGDYILQGVLKLKKDIDEDLFCMAWGRVIASMPILRTRIVQNAQLGLLQTVLSPPEDLSLIGKHVESLQSYLSHDKLQPMGIGDPLARYAMVRNECDDTLPCLAMGSHEDSIQGANSEANHNKESGTWFVCTLHHALYDGWSLDRVLNAAKETYTALKNDITSPTSKIVHQPGFNSFIQYVDIQQRQEDTKVYWQKTLADCRDATLFPPLPSNIQHPVADSLIEFICPPIPKVTSVDTTLSTLIRAAWAIVDSSHSNSDDLVFGATVIGRNAPVPGIEDIPGPTIATVPIRIRMPEKQSTTIADFLRAFQQQATDMIPFEQTGLRQIAKISGEDGRHASQFQTLVVVQPPENRDFEQDDVLGRWETVSELHHFTTYALMIQFTLPNEVGEGSEGGIDVSASFDSRVIEQWHVRKMLRQFGFVIQQLARDTTASLADVDLISPGDKAEVWSKNLKPKLAVESCVHSLIEKLSKTQPNEPAICAWEGEGDAGYTETTYADLDMMSSKLARHLAHHNISSEDAVPVCFEKSKWMVVAILAILKSGGTFVPLDPDHPASRHQEIIQQTKAKIVLTSSRCSSLFRQSLLSIVIINEANIKQLQPPYLPSIPIVNPRQSAYIIFTSGSTGVPKGVIVEHQAVSTSCLGHGAMFGFNRKTRALQFSSYTFDACITEIITTLIHGGCVCIPSEKDRTDNLPAAIRLMNVNWALLVPSVAKLLTPSLLPSLKTLVLGGEQVAKSDWTQWDTLVQANNAYGPTECCVICVGHAGSYFKSGLIGKSIASTSWVVDMKDHDKLAPLGSIGELVIEGPILARGYLNDSEKTAKAFIENPTWLLEGDNSSSHAVVGRQGTIYKTGDLVRLDSNGDLIYIGRKDGQAKIRGQRVDLGEIEHNVRHALQAEHVATEIVMLDENHGEKILAAFIQLGAVSNSDMISTTAVTEKDNSLAKVFNLSDATKKVLAERMPRYMIPDVYFVMDRLPTTVSGKMNRKELRKIGASFTTQQLVAARAKDKQRREHQPSNRVERLLQGIWSQLLNVEVESIGIDNSFIELGGDSIAAMRFVAEARNHDIYLNVADLLRNDSLATLAKICRVSPELDESEESPLLSTNTQQAVISSLRRQYQVEVSDVLEVLPTTYMQRFYVTRALQCPLEAFNYVFVDLTPRIDIRRLKDSCRELMEHYPILRTRFVFDDHQMYQAVLRSPELPFGTFSVEKSIEQTSQSICMQDLEQSSPLALGTSFMLLQGGTYGLRLIMRLSHAQYDGISLPILLSALASLYQHEPVSVLSSFAGYLAYAKKRQSTSAQYWTNLLRGSTLTDVSKTMPVENSARLEISPKNVRFEKVIGMPEPPKGNTIASLVSAAWALVLASFSGTDDVVYGYLVAGRNSNILHISEIAGPCLNIVPVRAQVGPDTTLKQLLQSVHTQQASLGECDAMGLDDIVKQCTDWPVDAAVPTLVQHQNVDERPEFRFANTNVKVGWFNNPSFVQRQITLVSYHQEDGLRIVLQGNTHILSFEQAEMLLGMVCKAVTNFSLDPSMKVGSFKDC
ncbi:unnamed protein product [Periconia digitata]|uniref:Carrier domain-containing protein n=1 Tax=Periconia digitata TaxID=1303443 RepID=A0A9W4XN14_9PLEO|nr:unnamed protein product [Periconia digitata]